VTGTDPGVVASAAPTIGRPDDLPLIDPALIDRARRLLEPHLPEVIADFYQRLRTRPQMALALDRLTPRELDALIRSQVDHVLLLATPGAPGQVMHERSRAFGRMHAMAGVEMDWYVDAVSEHRRCLQAALERYAGELDLVAVNAFLTERFMSDLHGALLGYRDVDSADNRVLLQVIQAVADARTVADLARGVVESLSCLDGMEVCFFGRTDECDRIQYEIGAGSGFEAVAALTALSGQPLVRATDDEAEGQGPLGRAWRSGEVQRCDSYETDPTVVPWRPTARRFGWRSSAAVPLAGQRGSTRAVLSLQANVPGYFASEARRALLEQVKQGVERTLAALEARPDLASGVSGYADRSTHLSRLARGEVQMLFQPLISLPEGRVTKLEALARLRGDGRLVSPAEFLPAFGDDELFTLFELGLHQSLAALRGWEAAGLVTGVSVNLPVASAEDDRYHRLVPRLLQEYGVDPRRLTLELLETGFVDRSLKERIRSFEELKELGVRLAQDDLGSGYSSLLRLRHFAFDDVKIDQSLVHGGGPTAGVALHFIKPITTIAHSLGLSVVIEGLEDDGLIDAALQLGVDGGQGYGIARPMPPDDVVGWVRDYRLTLDPSTPSTPLGALAGHVAWEHRVTAAGRHQGERPLGLDECPLSSYLDRHADATAVHLHEAGHAATLRDPGGEEQRGTWKDLVVRVLPGSP
jgi:EAL domain-containing protein (putative c-di-GMP-specific phosphodiesterase class I)